MSSYRQERQVMEDGSVSVYYYDASNKLYKLDDLNSDGQLQMTVEYYYDASGNNVNRIVKDNNNQLIRRLEFTFDKAGKVLEHREYDSKDNLLFVRVPENHDDI